MAIFGSQGIVFIRHHNRPSLIELFRYMTVVPNGLIESINRFCSYATITSFYVAVTIFTGFIALLAEGRTIQFTFIEFEYVVVFCMMSEEARKGIPVLVKNEIRQGCLQVYFQAPSGILWPRIWRWHDVKCPLTTTVSDDHL